MEWLRREFLNRSGLGIGAMGLAALLERDAAAGAKAARTQSMAVGSAHTTPRAKSIIYLFMAGGPSQLELFDDKPKLRELSDQKPPDSFTQDRRFAFLTGEEKLLGPQVTFGRYGQSGALLSHHLPYLREIADEICFLKGMHTDVFNHGPAKLLMQTGASRPGNPSMGSWITYGLGSEADNLPGFVVLQSGDRGPRGGSALWSSGFLPTTFQGVPFRGEGDPILNLKSPDGFDRLGQRSFTQGIADLNRIRRQTVNDPEIDTRTAAYEMAYQMQISAPELMDVTSEPEHVLKMYGGEPGKPSFANNALLARRLVERGVRFVQLYHTDWDNHGGKMSLSSALPNVCKQVDQASVALVKDLKQRGLLEDTLVVWGGEFGRTPMGEVRNSENDIGRDHHVDAYTVWLAGGGVKRGISHGRTDDLGFSVVEGNVHVHDLQATILHLFGFDHEQLTYRFQGRDFRLTDVHGRVVQEILA